MAAAVVVALALYNNLLNVRPPPAWLYLGLNLSAAVLLTGLASTRLSLGELGLVASRSGLVLGLASATLVALVLAVALAVPALRPLLADARVARFDRARLAFEAGVRIPFGTVVLEEVAFRGVLLALLGQRWSLPLAVLGSSAVFGVWHVTPTLQLVAVNAPQAAPLARALAVAGGVVVTFAAGVVLSLLRLAGGGLLAPALAHWAANALGAGAAFAATHPPGRLGGMSPGDGPKRRGGRR